MSGSTIGGIAGAAIGFWIGGPAGAQWGWMIGSAVGGYVDPEKVQGPRLTDAMQQTSREGVPITQGDGTFVTMGNLIWVQPGPPTEHPTTKRQGKGGNVKETTFTYTRSFAIGICRAIERESDGLYDPIAGILMTKENGKIVYDARPDDQLLALGMTAQQISASRAASAAFLQKVRFHLGGEDQLPDPTIEAWKGAGNVPAYRGLSLMVGIDFDVTRMEGGISQYQFVVSTGGTTADSCVEEANLVAWWPLDDASRNGVAREIVAGRNGRYSDTAGVGAAAPLNYGSSASFQMQAKEDFMVVDAFAAGTFSVVGVDAWSASVWCQVDDDAVGGVIERNFGTYWNDTLLGHNGWLLGLTGVGNMVPVGGMSRGSGVLESASAPSPLSEGSTAFMLVTWEKNPDPDTNGTLRLYLNGTLATEVLNAQPAGKPGNQVAVGGYAFPDSYGVIGKASDLKLYHGALTAQQVADNYLSPNNPDLIAIPDAPGWYVRRDGTVVSNCTQQMDRDQVVLGDFVAKVFRKWGLSSSQYDVSQLTDIFDGYRYLLDGTGADAIIGPLMQAFQFDVADWDGKIHCVKRGGESLLTLTMDDLAERDGEALEWETIQEAELLRAVNVNYYDPAANFEVVPQKYERRAGTVQAQGEQSIGLPLTLDATKAAQIAEKRVNCAWAENKKGRLSLPIKFSRLTATDVVTVVDAAAVSHRIRLMDKQEEGGVMMLEAPRERQSAYTGSVPGVTPSVPTFPNAPLIGPSQLAVMNLPALREADDEVGLHVAVRGFLPLWSGAQLQLISGGDVTPVAEMDVAATIGYTTTDLAAWPTPEFSSTQSVTIWLPVAPESVDYETLLRYNNRAALKLDDGTWQVLQYQTVVANGGNSYTLSGLLLGRYNTTSGAAASGATFVLLDAAVQFMRAERWMIGETLTLRAVSYGTDPDANGQQAFDFDICVSQTEWAPHYVEAERDGSDNVTASCIVRARLGAETAPAHSKYFTGIRFTYSDGVDSFSYDVTQSPTAMLPTAEHTYTAAQQTTDFGSVPGALIITVAALNSITGASAPTAGITV